MDIAQEWSFPWLPVGLLMSQKFDSVSKIGKLALPVLVVHGAADRDVPSRFGQALYAAATGPKKLLLVEDAASPWSDHNGVGLANDQAVPQLFAAVASQAAKSAFGITMSFERITLCPSPQSSWQTRG